MIDTEKKLLFIHIPKTAGTSITMALAGTKDARTHWTLRHHLPFKCRYLPNILFNRELHTVDCAKIMIQKRIGNRIPIIDNQYRIFSVVRNPWARTVSWYRDVMRHEPHRRENRIPDDITFERFIVEFGGFWGLRKQTHWLVDWAGLIDIDYIAKQENLTDDWPRICELIGTDAELPHINADNQSYNWREYYTDQTRRLIADRYREEIELFGYSFD